MTSDKESCSLADLETNPLFEGVSRELLEAIRTETQVVDFAVNDVVFQQGDTANTPLYLLLSGRIRISRARSDGVAEILAMISSPSFFGEMAVLLPGERSATATVDEAARVAVITRPLFERLIEQSHMAVLTNVVRSLVTRLRDANDTALSAYLRYERLAVIGAVVQKLAHDLRNPLNVVFGAADILAGEIAPKAPLEEADRLRRAGHSMNGMIEDVLGLASNKPRRPPELFSATELFKNIDDFGLNPIAASGRIHVNRQIDSVPQIFGDRIGIERALLNLIRNAKEATPVGGHISFSFIASKTEFEFVVSDSGKGIPEEIRSRLFEPFITAGKPGGTGLGLAVVKQIVDEHGGQVTVRSDPGDGTSFIIRIPRGVAS